jgi:dTDP-4-dehydrorhamnose reductase
VAWVFNMTILITGANGFLGHYLIQQLLLPGYKIIATGKGESRLLQHHESLNYASLDFTDPFAVHDSFERFQPNVVVHAGAMANVDECENNQWQAFVNNVEGTLNLLSNAEEHGAHFIFISTDFVFDGESGPYDETSPTNPVNFYGKTKLDAEDAVKEYPFDWTIVRTVLIYGKNASGGDNILTVVKKKLSLGETYSAVDDIVRTPTYVEDLAKGITAIIERKRRGIYNLSGKDVLTPYQMAFKTAEYLQLDSSLIKKVNVADLHSAAKRPRETVFILDKAKQELNYDPISFEEGLKKIFT